MCVCGVLGECVGHYKNDVVAEWAGGMARENIKKEENTSL